LQRFAVRQKSTPMKIPSSLGDRVSVSHNNLRRRKQDTQDAEVVDLSLRVLIVDDSETTRRILRTIIKSHYWLVCGEADNGWSGVKKFEELKPDVVILDLSMPDISGIEAAHWMTESDPTVPLILFTVLETEGIEGEAKRAGIRAIVSKAQVWKLLTSIEIAVRRNSN
jgi:two-component system chemotaxis response regulator CheY